MATAAAVVMTVVEMTDDEELRELSQQVRDIVGLAYRLARDIDRTVDGLTQFVPRATMIERRNPSQPPYQGVERRRD